MLELNNITVYTEQLVPRSGYEVSKALCLTYSLDLTMLLAANVSLFLGRETEGTTDRERYDVLASLQSARDKLRVYCHAGHIAVPETYNRLYQLIEPSVKMITLTEGSFHPKLWLIQYKSVDTKSEDRYFKLIVLSRNLTDSRDWDVSFYSDGKPTKGQKENKALISYIKSLPLSVSDTEFCDALLNGLQSVEFELPENCSDWRFLGFPAAEIPVPSSVKRLAIISPFLSGSRLEEMLNRVKKGKVQIFSRQEELDSLPEKLSVRIEAYTLKESIVDAEDLVREDFGDPKPNELHAKVYFWEDSKGCHALVGSANCTVAAFTINHEALIQMDFKKSIYDRLVLSLLGDDDDKHQDPGLFTPYVQNAALEKDDVRDTIAEIQRNITLGMPHGIISKASTNYSMAVKFAKDVHIPQGYTVHLHPYGQDMLSMPLVGAEVIFQNIGLQDLTAFIVFVVEKPEQDIAQSFMMRLEISCDPQILADREAALYRTLFTSMKKLLTYLAWLIEEDGLESPEIHLPRGASDKAHRSDGNQFDVIPFYERLIVIASENPFRLRKIGKVIELLRKQEDIDLADFALLLRFWDPFAKLLVENVNAD